MAGKLEELEGVFRGENRRFDTCLLGKIQCGQGNWVTIKGDAEPDEMSDGIAYRFYGRWASYKNRHNGSSEQQFHFQTFVEVQSHDRAGIVAYLLRAGEGNGLGKATADRIYSALGSDAVKIIREKPETLFQFSKQITTAQAEQIASVLKSQKATEDATIELTNLLHGRGFPKTIARSAIKRWGNKASRLIARDPYRLKAFPRVGFKLCDKLYLALGLPRDSRRRQGLAAWYSVHSEDEGSTWVPVQRVAYGVNNLIGELFAKPIEAIKFAVRLGKIAPDHYGALSPCRTTVGGAITTDKSGDLWLAETSSALAEQNIARSIVNTIESVKPRWITEYRDFEVITPGQAMQFVRCHRCGRELTAPQVFIVDGKPYGPTCIQYVDGDQQLLSLKEYKESLPAPVIRAIERLPSGRKRLRIFSSWPEIASIKNIDAHQAEELSKALSGPIGVLTGSPGTGKTHTLGMLVRAIVQSGMCPMEDIAIATPTAAAKIRVNSFLKALNLPVAARTVHSHLGWGATILPDGSKVMGFSANRRNPWPYKIMIFDESSMIDTQLMSSIFDAMPRGCHALFVGDPEQLPPVGKGKPFSDLIESGIVGVGELKEIKRASGGIVEACAAIRDGLPWDEGDNLTFDEVDSSEEKIEALVRFLRYKEREGFDPVWDSSVIVAVNGKSPLSRKAVNARLQDEFNGNETHPGTIFKIDDKVVCLDNDKFTNDDAPNSEKQVEVANGEIGRVVSIQEKYIVVEIATVGDCDPVRRVRVPLVKQTKKKTDGEEDSDQAEDESGSGAASWDLAYAISCHKSQGTEQPIVVVMLDDYAGAKRICQREWIYVAISRARQHCRVIGRKRLAFMFCRNKSLSKRKTLLKETLRLEYTNRIMDGFW